MPRSDSPLRDRMVFLVGAPRSGTNWLERILTAHPAVIALPTETHLVSHGLRPLSELFQHANPGAPEPGRTFMPRGAFLDSCRDLLDRVILDSIARQDPTASLVVERTPSHVLHLDLIHDVFPDSKVVHIVRDGRAVARSLVSMPWGPTSIAGAAELWRDSVEGAKQGEARFGERFLELRYEDLLTETRDGVEALTSWLGLELTDFIWQRIRVEAGAEFNVDRSAPGVLIDKWRGHLSDGDLRAFERIAGEQLDAHGYERVAKGRNGAGEAVRTRLAAVDISALRHPRRVARRSRARREQGETFHHRLVVADFERCVAAGDDAGARALLGNSLWTRIDDGGTVLESRDRQAADALLKALSAHQERGFEALTGTVDITHRGVTTTATYRLDDGSRWMRVAVYAGSGGPITRVSLSRYEMKPDADA